MNCPRCSREMAQDEQDAFWCAHEECETTGYWYVCDRCETLTHEDRMASGGELCIECARPWTVHDERAMDYSWKERGL